MSPRVTDTSFIENRPPNVAVQFWERVHKSPDNEAYRFPVADDKPWRSMTWRETGDRVEKLAAGLLALGLESEQRVGIAASTRIEWILADLAVMCAGGATTTVYPSTMSSDVAYILADSECRIVFAEDDTQVQKLREHRSELPSPGQGRGLRRNHQRGLADRSGGPARAGGGAAWPGRRTRCRRRSRRSSQTSWRR